MKKTFFYKQSFRFLGIGILVASMIWLGIVVQGCSSDFDSDVKIESLDIPEEYNEVGVLHNEGLEYIFAEIRAEGIEYAKNPRLKNRPFMENKDEFIKQATLDFCNQHEKIREHSNIFTHALKDTPSLKSSGVDNFSPAVQQMLDEMTSVLKQEFKKNELPQLKARLEAINQKATTTLTESDAAIIYCATSTGYSSYHYWMNNYKKWYFALNYPEILEQYNNEELNQLQLKNSTIRTKGWLNDIWNTVEDWWNSASNAITDWWNNGGREVVAADAGGAAAGAMSGTVVAVSTATVGWGAIPAGAVAGGVYESADQIITIWILEE
ncbi:MAG: hypothetical protein LLF80_01505 [Porphyromonadaceae bacterium]|nr:hypothetical protein [Porphyromonadaceae bacterium]